MTRQVLTAAAVFDGRRLLSDACVVIDGGVIEAVAPLGAAGPARDLGPGVLAPGMVDLQVNGGDGLMLGPDLETIARLCAAHARLGATSILPTLITDTPETTAAVIAAGVAAAAARVPGFLGLHLEGPHLDPRRRGAHYAALMRPMAAADLQALVDAARRLPALMVTLAPEQVSPAQIAALTKAGVIVSLGHSDCAAEQAGAAFSAGARCATHLFNAMSQMTPRAPGLVGAALDGPARVGIIADGVHVADSCLRVALACKAPDALFLVSDAMAVAGTDLDRFDLRGRTVLRRDGRLTLQDGTLAGADVTLPRSVAHLVGLGVDPARALAMATRVPAAVIGAPDCGALRPGAPADLVHLDEGFALRAVWSRGAPVAEA